MELRKQLKSQKFEQDILIENAPVMHSFSYRFIKRLIDITVASLGLILLSPLFIILAILVKLSSQGPVFYASSVNGLGGRPFKEYKFRSMVWNAEKHRKELLNLNEMKGGPVFKIVRDPRITPLGRFLRKYSLDELPQLWNVLKGDMSLVGPRPTCLVDADHYTPWQWRRLSVLPGMTGLWQIHGRNQLKEFDCWIEYDLTYIDN